MKETEKQITITWGNGVATLIKTDNANTFEVLGMLRYHEKMLFAELAKLGDASTGITIGENPILKTSISKQNFSVRVLNCLKENGVETVGDLIKITRRDLLSSRNFGRKSIYEIEDFLIENNLPLLK